MAFLGAILAIHLSAILGIALNDLLAALGLKLPLFVTCLFGGILLTNILPHLFPRLPQGDAGRQAGQPPQPATRSSPPR